MSIKPGQLYLVATPIGNLEDITLRALVVLKAVAIIATEDTRHSGILMKRYGISTPLMSLHQHNEKQRCQKIIQRLSAGDDVALVSDAGTPLISDPGYVLVREVREAGFNVVPIPGACAAIAALTASGLSTEQFVFVGFLPAKGAKRQTILKSLATETKTMVVYESVHRILDLLRLMKNELGGERRICVAREMTKHFETIVTKTISDCLALFESEPEKVKGEYVVVVEGASSVEQAEDELQLEKLLRALLSECSLKQSVSIAVKVTGLKKKGIYEKALAIQDENKIG